MVRGHFALNGRKWDATYKHNKDKGDKNSKSDKDKKDKKDDSDKGPSLNLSFVQYMPTKASVIVVDKSMHFRIVQRKILSPSRIGL